MNAVALLADLGTHRLRGCSVHQLAHGAPAASRSHTHRDRHDGRNAGLPVWHAQSLHPVANALSGGVRGLAPRTLQDGHELFAALAIDQIAFARGLADGPGHGLECLVASRVAVRMVVGTEVVDVDE